MGSSFVALACIVFTTQAQQSQVNLRFLNSSTGYAIQSPQVVLQNRSSKKTVAFGDSPLFLEYGEWDVSVQAAGFQSTSSHIAVLQHAASTIDFFLDPIDPPAELITQNISALRRDSATLITGFVVDDESGLPLADVAVSASGTPNTTTNGRGFYQIHIPVVSKNGTPSVAYQKPGFRSTLHQNVETWVNGDWILNVRMKRGTGETFIDESKARTREAPGDTQAIDNECPTCSDSNPQTSNVSLAGVPLPTTIRVGRSCTGTSCTLVQVYSLETYVKYVLPAEWYSCWGSLSNGMNSLQAGAVAIRSYGLWYVYHPLTSTYDICDNTSCQAFGGSQSTNANNAVDATAGFILTDATLANVMRSEYSAENNNKGCGDGFTGTGSSWPCISDMVCQGQTPNGHGRGVCQWGTIRWANGTRVTVASPCAQGVSHGLGTKTWQEILAHYYPSYTLMQGGVATILGATPVPSAVTQGSTISIGYSVSATEPMPVMLAASIAPTGTTTYTSNSANDIKVNLSTGLNSPSRAFNVPEVQSAGTYDLLAALWYDKNNNNTIDAGDFVVNSQTYTGAITITLLPVQLVSFTAMVVANRNVELSWRTISEVSNYGFYIQKKRGGETEWVENPSSFVPGHGTTNVPQNYAFTDQNIPGGIWHYRLRQVDLQGSEHFSDPVQVSVVTTAAENTPSQFRLLQNYPNPFNPTTEIRFSVEALGFASLRVFDMLGREVANLFSGTADPAREYSVRLQAENLASGVYTYRLISGNRTESKRFVVVR